MPQFLVFFLLLFSQKYVLATEVIDPKYDSVSCELLMISEKGEKNPLLEASDLDYGTLKFDQVKIGHFIPAIDKSLELAKENVNAIINNQEAPNFENTILALYYSDKAFDVVGSYVSIYFSNNRSKEIVEIDTYYDEQVLDFKKWRFNNKALFEKVKSVYDVRANLGLDEKKLVEDIYELFEKNGFSLPEDQKKQFLSLERELSKLQQQFTMNLSSFRSLENFQIQVTDESELKGVPERLLIQAKETAKKLGKKGWIFDHSFTNYLGILKYAEETSLREKYWREFIKEGAVAPFDNREVTKKIVKIKHEIAQLLGYKTFAHRALTKRMAKTPKRVMQFLNDFAEKIKPQAMAESDELKDFRKSKTGKEGRIKPWDAFYWARLLEEEKYQFDAEQLRPYLEAGRVLQGAFWHAKKLYDLDMTKRTDLPTYHPDVEVYEVTRKQEKVGLLYVDLFMRSEEKRGGAWMVPYRSQDRVDGKRIAPIISINANFVKPTSGDVLLSIDEATTVFHEFGHALHGLLSDTRLAAYASPNVAWDFVEMPSQFMENYVYEMESLKEFAKHHETGEVLPQELYDGLIRSKNFRAASRFLGQLRLAALDMALYSERGLAGIGDLMEFETEVLEFLKIEEPFAEREPFTSSFSHIITGGYSAGYYSYKWSEVLDADAFAAFTESGDIFNPILATQFEELLSSGGSKDEMDLFVRFRGREPSVQPLLDRFGFE